MNNTTGTNEEKGDVLLFLHGWGCDGTIFKGLASTFKGVRCLTPDFRGFGCNPPPDRPWTIEDYARDVADYLEQPHCGKVTVIAHSFGCRVATVLAAEYPRYVKAMLFLAGMTDSIASVGTAGSSGSLWEVAVSSMATLLYISPFKAAAAMV